MSDWVWWQHIRPPWGEIVECRIFNSTKSFWGKREDLECEFWFNVEWTVWRDARPRV
jgi:hypothetical protein